MTDPVLKSIASKFVATVEALPFTPDKFAADGPIARAFDDALAAAKQAGRDALTAAPKKGFVAPASAYPGWTPFAYGGKTGSRGESGHFDVLADANVEIGRLRDCIAELTERKDVIGPLPNPSPDRTWTPYEFGSKLGKRGRVATFGAQFGVRREYGDSGEPLVDANAEIGFLRDRVLDLLDLPDIDPKTGMITPEALRQAKADSFSNGKREGRAELAREIKERREALNRLEDEIDDLVDEPNFQGERGEDLPGLLEVR